MTEEQHSKIANRVSRLIAEGIHPSNRGLFCVGDIRITPENIALDDDDSFEKVLNDMLAVRYVQEYLKPPKKEI